MREIFPKQSVQVKWGVSSRSRGADPGPTWRNIAPTIHYGGRT